MKTDNITATVNIPKELYDSIDVALDKIQIKINEIETIYDELLYNIHKTSVVPSATNQPE